MLHALSGVSGTSSFCVKIADHFDGHFLNFGYFSFGNEEHYLFLGSLVVVREIKRK